MAQLIPRAKQRVVTFNAMGSGLLPRPTPPRSRRSLSWTSTRGLTTAPIPGTARIPMTSGAEKIATRWFNALVPILNSKTGLLPSIDPRSGFLCRLGRVGRLENSPRLNITI